MSLLPFYVLCGAPLCGVLFLLAYFAVFFRAFRREGSCPFLVVAWLREVARADMESAPTVNHKFCNSARCFGGGQGPSLRDQPAKGRRGEQCSPVRFSGHARFCGRAMLAPTATICLHVGGDACIAPQSLPCVKGDSPQCGEMSRSDRGARRVSGCPAGAEGL